ncbi:hypothetical protein BBJ28_00023300 [Nothophytophthora sp. Chile5]|nr:hypothetical protein BBJ28_00023300 [Nothophytophthora sp. Chile5]
MFDWVQSLTDTSIWCIALPFNSHDATFPLPIDFFPSVKLSAAQIQNYETQVQKIVRNALAEYERHEAKGAHPLYGGLWVPVGTEGTLTAVRQESPAGLARSEFRVFGHINCDYRNFMDFYYAETSRQLFEWNQFMFGYAVDAVVLKNIHTKSSAKPHEYLGIKWTCLQPSSFSRKSDNCFLEYLAYTKDRMGRDVGIRVTLPVEIDECPDLYRTLKVKRVKTHSVTIVRPAGANSKTTQLFMMSENDFAGHSVSAKSFRKVMRVLADMTLFVDSKHISKQGMLSKANWVPKDSRKTCTSCSRTFNARRRYHCRLCGDIFCHHCVIVRGAPSNKGGMKQRVFQVVKTHFCKVCVTTMHQETDAANASNVRAVRAATDLQVVGSNNGTHLKQRKAARSGQHEGNPDWWDEAASEWSGSEWSETDSEDASKASLRASTLSQSSSHSSWSSRCSDESMEREKMSFVATLDVIDDEVAVLDEKPRRSKMKMSRHQSVRSSQASRQSGRQQQSRQSAAMLEVTEVIDTMDMLPMSEMRRQTQAGGTGYLPPPRKHSRRRSVRDSVGAQRPNSRTSSREGPTNRNRSSRSISQCLAEQEELLRCMLNASGVHSAPGVRSKRTSSRRAKAAMSATMPVQRPTVRLYEI